MIIVAATRNAYLQAHADQTHAEVILPNSLAKGTLKALRLGEKRRQMLWKERVSRDEDGIQVDSVREEAGTITLIRVENLYVADVTLKISRACGFKTSQDLRDEWEARHPRSPEVAIVWYALGDWCDTDRFLAPSGGAGGDFCVDAETEALTKRGWCRYDEIRDDDELLGYDIAAHKTQWERHTGVHVFPARARELIAIKGRSGTIVSTPSHRWPTLVISQRSDPSRTCPYCGESLGTKGYTKHARACEQYRLLASRYAALRTSYHSSARRAVAEEFGVSEQTVMRAARHYRGRPAREYCEEAVPKAVRRKVREERTTETLGRYAQLLNGAPCSSLPSDPLYEDAFVELVAWFCTEGSQKRYRNGKLRRTLGISQSSRVNEANVRDIERALNEVAPGHWKYGAPPNRRAEMKMFLLDAEAARPILEVAPDKAMTYDFILSLTREQLELLWYTWVRGDGSWHESQGRYGASIGQKELKRLEPLQIAIALLGDGSVMRYRDPVKHSYDDRFGFGEWTLRRSRRHIIDQGSLSRETILHDGIVWCPSTPSSYWLARRDGLTFLTGNTTNPRRSIDADAPVLTNAQIEALSAVNRQKDDGRRAAASAALAAESSSERYRRLMKATERMGDEARRAIRQEIRIIEQRVQRGEGRK